ncbi:hypothetical protein AQUCO_01700241v1 [Aquilegia coerulea]|uniref:Uncharacterized protein n=1 Tax=Aquilegia coerulea TaxID=218851 RepID=A0A2G5DLX0_AQUCA|nr:hypothetical protein AQUCO_01700241v1 [Aquilegia coerulea]
MDVFLWLIVKLINPFHRFYPSEIKKNVGCFQIPDQDNLHLGKEITFVLFDSWHCNSRHVCHCSLYTIRGRICGSYK